MMIEEIVEITMTEEIVVIMKGKEVDQERMIEGGADLVQEKGKETDTRKFTCLI